MGSTQINPLLTEYNKRLNSSHAPTARGAKKLLWACIHEAGHWAALAHFKVMVITAFVDRRSFVGSGYVIPGDYSDKITEAEYVVTLAGLYAIAELEPFIVREENVDTSKDGDIKAARKILDDVHGEDTAASKLFKEKNASLTRQLIHQNWPIIEALASELMKRGELDCGACRKVEIRYGIGRYAPTTTAKLKSAQEKLAAFHYSPATLLEALLAAEISRR